jgi:hypothetical protein
MFRNHKVLETGSVSGCSVGEGDTYFVGSLSKSGPSDKVILEVGSTVEQEAAI